MLKALHWRLRDSLGRYLLFQGAQGWAGLDSWQLQQPCSVTAQTLLTLPEGRVVWPPSRLRETTMKPRVKPLRLRHTTLASAR